jgi:hypothetical protein
MGITEVQLFRQASYINKMEIYARVNSRNKYLFYGRDNDYTNPCRHHKKNGDNTRYEKGRDKDTRLTHNRIGDRSEIMLPFSEICLGIWTGVVIVFLICVLVPLISQIILGTGIVIAFLIGELLSFINKIRTR